jgi:hypothetical protein
MGQHSIDVRRPSLMRLKMFMPQFGGVALTA